MAWISGEVGERGRLGRMPEETECLDKLPDEVADRRLGVELVPRAARLAKAFEVFSRAREARERLLLLWVRLVELEWW